MPHPVWLKLQWAEKRIRDLDVLVSALMRDCPAVLTERDPKTDEVIYRLRDNPTITPDFALLAGDVIQNIRTALDYLAHALIVANGKKPTDQTGFPILKGPPTAGQDRDTFRTKVHGMGQKAIDLILDIKPYKGGDPWLWPIHELNRREKHRLLFTVGAYLHSIDISQHIEATDPPLQDMERMARLYTREDIWAKIRETSYAMKAGDILFIDRPGAKVNEDIRFTIQVALKEQGIFPRENVPLFPVTYTAFHSIVKTVSRFNGMY